MWFILLLLMPILCHCLYICLCSCYCLGCCLDYHLSRLIVGWCISKKLNNLADIMNRSNCNHYFREVWENDASKEVFWWGSYSLSWASHARTKSILQQKNCEDLWKMILMQPVKSLWNGPVHQVKLSQYYPDSLQTLFGYYPNSIRHLGIFRYLA